MAESVVPDWVSQAPWDARPLESVSQVHWVQAEGGRVRVLHHLPEQPSGRVVVVLPGFGASVSVWQECYGVLQGQVEFYVIETLEKALTPLDDGYPDLNFDAMARQVQTALQAMGLENRDYVIMGASLLGTILAEGMASGSLRPGTAVAFDSLKRFWLPAWLTALIGPLLPLWFLNFGLSMGARVLLAGMKEEAQRERLQAIVDGAEPGRWCHSAVQNVWYNLYERVPLIKQEILFVVGVGDRVHDDTVSRTAARLAPQGRLIQVPSPEGGRERMVGALLLQLAQSEAGSLPQGVVDCEVEL